MFKVSDAESSIYNFKVTYLHIFVSNGDHFTNPHTGTMSSDSGASLSCFYDPTDRGLVSPLQMVFLSKAPIIEFLQ